MDVSVLHNIIKNANDRANQPYRLVFSKETWLQFKEIGFVFLEKEFKESEENKDSFLGNRKGINCYLLKSWDNV